MKASRAGRRGKLKMYRGVLTSGILSAAFLTAAIIGLTSGSVRREMDRRAAVGARIKSLARSPVSAGMIAARRRHNHALERQYAGVKSVVRRINQRTPLLPGLFPQRTNDTLAFVFIEKYQQHMAALPVWLHAGMLPNQAEIESAAESIADLKAAEAEGAMDNADAVAPRPPEPSQSRVIGSVPPSDVSTWHAPPSVGADSVEPKYDPLLRARVEKARAIWCYISPQTFDISGIVSANDPPSQEQLWYAQVALWIQQDVVEAVAAVNEAALSRLPPRARYVEHAVVKRLEGIRIWGYRVRGALVGFREQRDEPRAGAYPRTLIAGSAAGDSQDPSPNSDNYNVFDVVGFAFAVVIDQRDALTLLDALQRRNFYRCVAAGYEDVPDGHLKAGYLYGTEPVILLRFEMNAYMARDVFRPLMPQSVRSLLGDG